MPLRDEQAGQVITEALAATGGLLLGRVTYEIFARYWPNAPGDDPIAQVLNCLPKYVASTTLREPLPWSNSHLLDGTVAEAVARLKEEPGKDLRVIGSGQLLQTLMAHELVDRYDLSVFPLVLGSGKRLFKDGGPTTALRLAASRTFRTGILLLSYEPRRRERDAAGRLPVGSR